MTRSYGAFARFAAGFSAGVKIMSIFLLSRVQEWDQPYSSTAELEA